MVEFRAQLAMLFTSTMHLAIRLKKFKKFKKFDEYQFRGLKHPPCSPTSLHATSFFSIIDMKRCNSCVMTMWTNFKRSQRAQLRGS
jgi:hypothetical protein